MVFGVHLACEVDLPTGDVCVDIHAAREDDAPAGIDHPAARRVGYNPTVGDAEIPDTAVDAIGGIVYATAGDAKHVRCYRSPRSATLTRPLCAENRASN